MAIIKPKNPADDPKTYRSISLLCVPLKVLERLLLTRLESIIEPSLPTTQAGFRSGRSTVDQIIHLTEDMENGFEERKKAGLVLVDLTAAYDTVWLSGLTLKMLHVIPDHHMVRFLQELISNRRFTFQTSDGRLSRPRFLKNGVPQGSILSPLLFNIYCYRKFRSRSVELNCSLCLLFAEILKASVGLIIVGFSSFDVIL